MAVKAKAGKPKKAGKAKKVEKEPEVSEPEEVEEKEEAKGAAVSAETALVVAKDAPATDAKGKKRKTKAHRLEEAVARTEAEEEANPAAEHVAKGVLYLGHIPFGFGEPQMRKYFNQFGTVLRLRLSRSKSNAASKGYAFIEFEEREVAKIVAATMNGYLLFGKKLVSHVMDQEKVHPRLFKGWNRVMINYTKLRGVQARERYNDRPEMDVDGERLSRTTCQQVQRRQRSDKKLQDLLQTLDVDFDLSAFELPATLKLKADGSPKLKAEAAPEPAKKRKQAAAEAEAAAAELVAEDEAAASAAKSPAKSPATATSSPSGGKKARHRRRKGAPGAEKKVQAKKGGAKKGETKTETKAEVEPPKKVAKKKKTKQ